MTDSQVNQARDIHTLHKRVDHNSQMLEIVLKTIQDVQLFNLKMDKTVGGFETTLQTLLSKDVIKNTKETIDRSGSTNLAGFEEIIKEIKYSALDVKTFVKHEMGDIVEMTEHNYFSELFGKLEKTMATKFQDMTSSIKGMKSNFVSLKTAVNEVQQSGDEMKEQLKRSTNVSVFSFTKLKQEMSELKKPTVSRMITATLWMVLFMSVYDLNRSFNNQALTMATLQENLNINIGGRLRAVYESTPLYHDVRDLTSALNKTLVVNTDMLADLGVIKSGQQELKPDLDAKLFDLAAEMTELRDISSKQFATVDAMNKMMVYFKGQSNINSHGPRHNSFGTQDEKAERQHGWLYVLLSICVETLVCLVLTILVWFIGYSLLGEIKPSLKSNNNHEGFSFWFVGLCMATFMAIQVYAIWDSFVTINTDHDLTNVYWGWLCYILSILLSFGICCALCVCSVLCVVKLDEELVVFNGSREEKEGQLIVTSFLIVSILASVLHHLH